MRQSTVELRSSYAHTLEDRNNLLDKLRKDIPMTSEEKEASWVCLSDLATCVSRRHFKKKQWTFPKYWWVPVSKYNQSAYDKHTDRMLIILEFMRCYQHLDMNLVISRLKSRITWIELILEAKTLGLNLELGDVAKASTKTLIRDIITGYRIHKLIGLDQPINEVIVYYAYETYKKTGHFPSYQRIKVFTERYYNFTLGKELCSPKLECDLPENVFSQIVDEVFSEHDDG